MASISEVHVTDVTIKNIDQLWPRIILNITKASFIAVDVEMSGLGTKNGTMASHLDDRYKALVTAAKTRSVISLGVACFKAEQHYEDAPSDENETCDSNKNQLVFCVSVYNIVLLCSDPYTIDPDAVKFLVAHGFNFNQQFADGIPYHKGNDTTSEKSSQLYMRRLFSELIRQRKPLVVHNGFADLVFLYQCFYAECPNKLASFMADLSEMFPSGIYDTKYIAEYLDHTSASFLLFVFKFSYLNAIESEKQGRSSLKIVSGDKTEWTACISLQDSSPAQKSDKLKPVLNLCEQYSAHGWCLAGVNCRKSHNINAIIEEHKKEKTSRKRKRKRSEQKQIKGSDNGGNTQQKRFSEEHNSGTENGYSDTNNCPLNQTEPDNFSHRSGIDSFMTGYTFAAFIASRCTPSVIANFKDANLTQIEGKVYSDQIPFLDNDLQKSIVNKLFLSGKNIPLSVCKSLYTTTSNNHSEKLVNIYIN
ncbi:target of EGR1 protein 1-like [Clavelina lepadiformis]|uniref:target of EGR1 protein 1-like n=1 Tax=Clavelina lepadiformis TaxID=159417 RepID=UPI004040FA44